MFTVGKAGFEPATSASRTLSEGYFVAFHFLPKHALDLLRGVFRDGQACRHLLLFCRVVCPTRVQVDSSRTQLASHPISSSCSGLLHATRRYLAVNERRCMCRRRWRRAASILVLLRVVLGSAFSSAHRGGSARPPFLETDSGMLVPRGLRC
jgi:hypothetical protein